jgi:hypothetical protein
MHGKRLGRSPTFATSNAEMHSASLPIKSVAMLWCASYGPIVGLPSPGPRARVGSERSK